MNTKDIAKELINALAASCKGIHHDYNLKVIEHIFDEVLRNAGHKMSNERLPF